MPTDNFVERVHAYSKWLLGLETENQRGTVEMQGALFEVRKGPEAKS